MESNDRKSTFRKKLPLINDLLSSSSSSKKHSPCKRSKTLGRNDTKSSSRERRGSAEGLLETDVKPCMYQVQKGEVSRRAYSRDSSPACRTQPNLVSWGHKPVTKPVAWGDKPVSRDVKPVSVDHEPLCNVEAYPMVRTGPKLTSTYPRRKRVEVAKRPALPENVTKQTTYSRSRSPLATGATRKYGINSHNSNANNVGSDHRYYFQPYLYDEKPRPKSLEGYIEQPQGVQASTSETSRSCEDFGSPPRTQMPRRSASAGFETKKKCGLRELNEAINALLGVMGEEEEESDEDVEVERKKYEEECDAVLESEDEDVEKFLVGEETKNEELSVLCNDVISHLDGLLSAKQTDTVMPQSEDLKTPKGPGILKEPNMQLTSDCVDRNLNTGIGTQTERNKDSGMPSDNVAVLGQDKTGMRQINSSPQLITRPTEEKGWTDGKSEKDNTRGRDKVQELSPDEMADTATSGCGLRNAIRNPCFRYRSSTLPEASTIDRKTHKKKDVDVTPEEEGADFALCNSSQDVNNETSDSNERLTKWNPRLDLTQSIEDLTPVDRTSESDKNLDPQSVITLPGDEVDNSSKDRIAHNETLDSSKNASTKTQKTKEMLKQDLKKSKMYNNQDMKRNPKESSMEMEKIPRPSVLIVKEDQGKEGEGEC